MFPRFLLLLTILGPGISLQLQDPWGHKAKEAPGPVHLRARRQVAGDDDFEDVDYTYGTEPPETLTNVTNTVAAHVEHLTTMATLEQTVSMAAGTSETVTAQVATTGPAGPDARKLAVGMLRTESATQWSPTTVGKAIRPTSTKAETSQPASREAETSNPAPMEAETSNPAPMEAETSNPAPMEAETSNPAPTEAETSNPAPMEAETSNPAPMEVEISNPAPMEAETSNPAPMEAETSQPAATETAATAVNTSQLRTNQVVESLLTRSAATEAPSTEPTPTETVSSESKESTTFSGTSMTHKVIGHLPDSALKKGLIVTPGSSLAPTLQETSDLIPVKQCLLAILILASLATIFLVCTVVLAVRLSRKTHMYPVRNYSPTEMICISSLLPEGGDGAPVTANGGLPKVQDLKTEPSGDPDGDELTLHSFLP